MCITKKDHVKTQVFLGIGPLLTFCLSGGPWNTHGACGFVIDHADVLQQAYTEAQGRLEVNLSTILNLVGFNQFISCSGSVILLKVVPCPLPSCFKISSQTFFSIFSS